LTLEEYWDGTRVEVEAALVKYLHQPPAAPAVVVEAMRYSLMAGGKRFRPLLTLAAADAIADADRSRAADPRSMALPAACAIEMIHTYSLIHDDLPAMDDDTLRRGRPTLHVVAGDGMAILAGDGLHAEAFTILVREPVSSDAIVVARKLRVIGVIAGAAGPAGMVGGQAIDLQSVRPGPGQSAETLDASALQAMHSRKTGALIRAAAVCGAIMAGANEAAIAGVDKYATDIGLAFQIVDDILDVEAESATLGKTAGKDAAAGKPTYPAVFGLDQSRKLAAECLAKSEQTLHDMNLSDSHLGGIARWVVTRQS
jgi:geranylgeranyl diphosphate synthase type II